MRFDFTDLRLFHHVVQTGSITRGAERTHLALASASARIRGMEAMLGVPLLKRGRRGVEPTDAGRSLLDHARIVLQQLETMRGDLGAYSRGLKGSVRILANTSALSEHLPAPSWPISWPPTRRSTSISRIARARRSARPSWRATPISASARRPRWWRDWKAILSGPIGWCWRCRPATNWRASDRPALPSCSTSISWACRVAPRSTSMWPCRPPASAVHFDCACGPTVSIRSAPWWPRVSARESSRS